MPSSAKKPLQNDEKKQSTIVATASGSAQNQNRCYGSSSYSTQTLTRLGVLLAAAIALRLIENALAYLLPLPGAHLGLANCVTIIVLYMYSTGQAALFLSARILLVGLLFTGLLTPGFTIGLGGAVLSFIFMALAIKHNWFSALGIGLLGAFCHNCGQIAVAAYLMNTGALFSYLPFLLLLGIPTGLFTGLLAKIFLERFANL